MMACETLATRTSSAGANEPRFVTIALGTGGGLTEDNLSSYLLAPAGSTAFVALDAGTLLTGLQHANRKGNLSAVGGPQEICPGGNFPGLDMHAPVPQPAHHQEPSGEGEHQGEPSRQSWGGGVTDGDREREGGTIEPPRYARDEDDGGQGKGQRVPHQGIRPGHTQVSPC
jgi:hypothetical protein